MKKRFMALVLAVLMVLSMVSTSAFAVKAEDITPEIEDIFNDDYTATNNYELAPDKEREHAHNILIGGISLDDGNSPASYSADSTTNTYSGYLLSESEFSYVPVYVSEGSIVQATLVCPENPNLDYNLSLCVADEEGYLTKVIRSDLQTYIDPNTGKTLDEGISYVHNQASEGYLYIVVDSAKGSSSVNPFYLTVSTDVSGSYDSHEPNDSAFYATPLTMTTTLPSRASADGSLNVINDQDWYSITPSADVVVSLSAGNYKAEVYQVVADNTLALADFNKSEGYYALDKNRTYFVKVYSDASETDFSFGEYTLEIADQSIYTTMATAFNIGYWTSSSYRGAPNWGQSTAFYKFRLYDDDKVYVRMRLPDEELIEMVLWDSRGRQISNLVSSNNSGDVIHSGTDSSYLVLPIDGTQVSDGIVYIQVGFGNRTKYHSSPSILTRIRKGSGDFQFSGTCINPGNSASNVISLNLTNNSTIPNGCTVTSASTKGTMNSSVGGVCHMLRPASHDWLTPRTQSVVLQANYDIPDDIPVKQIWYFRYDQTAFASTKMTNITLELWWEQDIQFDNYGI